MTKFKIGDKVRIKKVLGAINHETNEPFKKNVITTVTGIITDYHVRVGHGLNYQDSGNVVLTQDLELVAGSELEPEEELVIDDKLTHLNSIVIKVPKKDASGSYVNYNWLLKKTLLSTGVLVKLSKCDKLVSINESVEYINVEALHEDLVLLTKSMNPVLNELRNLNQTKLDLTLNGQHFILDTQEEMDYSTTLINGLFGNI